MSEQTCKTCHGSGFVAYMTHAGGAEGEGCPDCEPSDPTDLPRVLCLDCGWHGFDTELLAQACPVCDGRCADV